MMKTSLAILIGFALIASAQTNFFAVLVCKNASYTNASIVRTNPPYVIVDYTNGAARVAITNLPQPIQDSIGYDPASAAADAASNERRKLQKNPAQPPPPPPFTPVGN